MMKVLLKDACSIIMGQSPDSKSYNNQGDGLPFYQGNADFGDVHPITRVWCASPIRIAKEGDILISVRAPIGAMNIATTRCCIGRGLAALRPNEADFDNQFLFYVLQSMVDRLIEQGTGSTFKAIGKSILENTELPYYSLAEQAKIVSELNKLGKAIVIKKTQLALLDEVVKSRFVEMFGDLKTNPNGWPEKQFSEFAEIDGNMTTDYEKYADSPHIGIDSIEKGTGELRGYRTVREDGVISGKYIFTPEHIIYSKIRPNLNKVALPHFSGLCSADAYPILPHKDVCNRIYLATVMRSDFFLDYILQFSSRANMPKVNRKEISGFVMPMPPLWLQNEFASFVEQVDKSKLVIKKTLSELEELKDSLMQKYFFD